MKITNLSFVLALLALKTGGCMIYQGDDKTNNLCYKFVDGQLQSFYPAPTDVTGKERPIAAPNANPGSPTWNQMLETNWTVEVLQVPESLVNESIEGLSLKTIQADNAQAVDKFMVTFVNAISGLKVEFPEPVVEPGSSDPVVISAAPKATKGKTKPAVVEPVVESIAPEQASELVVKNTDQSTSQAEEGPGPDA